VIFLSLLVGAFLVYRIFFASKPAAVAPAPVIVQNVPPPAPPVVVTTPPPAPALPRPSFKVAPSLPEKEPEARVTERELRISLEATIKSSEFITKEKKLCLDRVHHSVEYLALNVDVDAKKTAKEAVSEKLRQDNASGADTDQDVKDLKAASTDWIAAAAKLTTMEDDALAADPALTEKEAVFNSAASDVERLKAKLIAEITQSINESATDPDCAVRSVKLDVTTWSIVTELDPKPQADSAVMADAAVTQIGNILQNSLCQSPFSWTKAKFAVYGKYDGKPAVEFQVRYDRQTVDAANFDRLHPKYFDDQGVLNLSDRVWLSPVIDTMQGRSPALLAAVKERTGDAQDYDTLFVGGYVRSDGSKCPLVYYIRPHVQPKSSLSGSVIPHKSPMPPSYSSTPMPGSVLDRLPDLMTPPD
jgi:hypothetical protein